MSFFDGRIFEIIMYIWVLCFKVRGGSPGHLHLQMVYRLHIFSLLVLNQVVKRQFG
jgi:hypothetical protein